MWGEPQRNDKKTSNLGGDDERCTYFFFIISLHVGELFFFLIDLNLHFPYCKAASLQGRILDFSFLLCLSLFCPNKVLLFNLHLSLPVNPFRPPFLIEHTGKEQKRAAEREREGGNFTLQGEKEREGERPQQKHSKELRSNSDNQDRSGDGSVFQ